MKFFYQSSILSLLLVVPTALSLTLPEAAIEVLERREGVIAGCGTIGAQVSAYCYGGPAGGITCKCGPKKVYGCQEGDQPAPKKTAECKSKGCGCQ